MLLNSMVTYAKFFHKLLVEQQQPTGTTPPTGTAPPEPQAPPGTPADAMADPAAMAPPATTPPPPPDPMAAPAGDTPPEEDSGDEGGEEKLPATVDDVVKDAEDRAEKTTDVLSLLKGVKADLQKGTLLKDPAHAKELVNTLKSSENSNLVDVGDRLAKYLSVKATAQEGGTGTMNNKIDNKARIQETIKKLVKLKVKKLLAEQEDSISTSVELGAMDKLAPSKPVSADFDALRWIGLEAQKNALSFESTIRKELEIDPNTMDKAGQDAYSAAMEQFHMAMVAAVTDAVNAVKDLPKKSEEKEQVTETPTSPAPPAVPPSQPAAAPPAPQPAPQKRPAV